ncbi:MAG: hypothetical protein HY875_03535 [Chloroflexi bacterium]|nr:hypothetical protein [Chloroflexota bacterium]
MLTAALVPGAAVFVEKAHACSPIPINSPVELVPTAGVIVLGEVTSASWREQFTVHVDAYLKGPALKSDLTFTWANLDNCNRLDMLEGSRVVMFLGSPPAPQWPSAYSTFVFVDGRGINLPHGADLSEADLIQAIRSITGQYAVPAANADEGASIDWIGTVVPVTAALLVVFAIGLVLMRTWHRIDPS